MRCYGFGIHLARARPYEPAAFSTEFCVAVPQRFRGLRLKSNSRRPEEGRRRK
jgi:hypothetical protein